MPRILRRSGLGPLALSLLAVAACADEPLPTHPAAVVAPRLSTQPATGEILTVTTDSGGADVVGSLAWAVSAAPAGATIRFAPELAGDTIVVGVTVHPSTPITIEGPADGGITLRAGGPRVIRASAGITLRNVTLTGGSAGFGSAILSSGPVRLEHSTVTGNSGGDGAIYADDVTLVNSTVSNNDGGGISYPYSGRVTLINSTVAHNWPRGIGPTGTPGPVPTVILRNSIVANNGEPRLNCSSAVGVRVEGLSVSDDVSCGASPALLVADPLLGPLADNGGPTATVRFGHRSPALDAGIDCGVATDQRYVARGARCDVGAVEFTDHTVVTLTIDPAQRVGADGSATVTGTVRCSRDETFGLAVDLKQEQKPGRVLVQAADVIGLPCAAAARPWSATLRPTGGAFSNGAASASVRTQDAPAWVAPSVATAAVKLAWSRK